MVRWMYSRECYKFVIIDGMQLSLFSSKATHVCICFAFRFDALRIGGLAATQRDVELGITGSLQVRTMVARSRLQRCQVLNRVSAYNMRNHTGIACMIYEILNGGNVDRPGCNINGYEYTFSELYDCCSLLVDLPLSYFQ